MEFEKKLAALEEIAAKLENKNIGLEEGIRLFEEGLLLTRECIANLSESQSRICAIKEEMGKLLETGLEED